MGTQSRPGDATLVINGDPRTLRLTLGALAEIERAFGANGLADLADRLKHPSSDDLLTILAALLKGGGDPLAMAALAASDVDLPAAAAAIATAFKGLGDAEASDEQNADQQAPGEAAT